MKNLIKLLLSVPSNFLDGYRIQMDADEFVVNDIVANGTELSGCYHTEVDGTWLDIGDINDKEVTKLVKFITDNYKPKRFELKPLIWTPNASNGKKHNNDAVIHTEYAKVDGFDYLLFEVDKRGKRNPKFVLLSYPFANSTFTKANNSKILGEFETLEQAKDAAEKSLKEYLSIFLLQIA